MTIQPAVTVLGAPGPPHFTALAAMLEPHGLRLVAVSGDAPIPGSFWGAPEAGLMGDVLYVRSDTPLHSALHEACHYLCMNPGRRAALDTDAGGDHPEENAVCYLSVLLADALPDYGAATLWRDMDTWGYSFRLGSAERWFREDAEDAREWLLTHQIVREDGSLLGRRFA
jgi:hypothetical protein